MPLEPQGPVVRETFTLERLRGIVLADLTTRQRKNPAKSVRRCYAHLIAHFGADADVSTIGYDALLAYAAARMESNAAPASVRHELSFLRIGLRVLARMGKLSVPPFPTIQVDNARQGFFEDAELKEVLRYLPEDYRPFVGFLSLTGWRFGEARGLTWINVDFTAKTVRLEPKATKNREPRVFPFEAWPELQHILELQRARTTAIEERYRQVVPWVFWRDHQGAARRIGNMHSAWTTACVRAGQPGKLLHDFRRTAVRRLERAGVARSAAMKLTGHKTEQIYTRYAIVSERDLSEAVSKVARLLDFGK